MYHQFFQIADGNAFQNLYVLCTYVYDIQIYIFICTKNHENEGQAFCVYATIDRIFQRLSTPLASTALIIAQKDGIIKGASFALKNDFQKWGPELVYTKTSYTIVTPQNSVFCFIRGGIFLFY